MRVRAAMHALLLAALGLAAASCSGRGLVRQFEYEEEMYLALDGSATIIVNASVPALVALHGLPLNPSPTARLDRERVRDLYQSPVTRVTRVSRPWRRAGRRFVQVRVETDDVRSLAAARPFAWSTYRLDARDGTVVYGQRVGPASGPTPPGVNWSGQESIAIRLHLPSRIQYHNAPSREVERGNILTWDQPLSERLAGQPIAIEVRMDESSILVRTLTVFGVAVGAAMLVLATIVWWVRRKGREGESGG